MAHFILVHGAWHGGWCWSHVVPRLEALGHRVEAPDLPSHGADPRPAVGVTLEDYASSVRALVDDAPEPVVLVGHSMGGLVIGRVSELVPGKVALGIYVTAILPDLDGAPLVPVASAPLRKNLVPSEDQSTIEFAASGAREVFYGQCTDEDVAFALERLCPQSSSVLARSPMLTASGFGGVPRIYIECLQDQALTLESQREMVRRTGCQGVRSIDTDHSPFFSAPDELVSILHEAALPAAG
jgi:pimeloyl-ACP methyl ester carboxylesterase